MRYSTSVNTNVILSLLTTALLFSCSLTTTKPRQVEFAGDTHALRISLDSIVHAENVNIDGIEKTVNTEVSTELDIRMFNGTNFPTSDDDILQTSKKIAGKVRSALKDPNEFDFYKVLFVTTTDNPRGSKFKGHILKKEDF